MSPAASTPVAVRETVCKTILNRSGLTDYSLNCYTGCTHRCAYCYARYMQRFHPHDELQRRVTEAAQRLSLADRVTGCF